MLELSVIRDTVMNVAQAITAALEIETEIINENLEIIGGTGRYTKKRFRFGLRKTAEDWGELFV